MMTTQPRPPPDSAPTPLPSPDSDGPPVRHKIARWVPLIIGGLFLLTALFLIDIFKSPSEKENDSVAITWNRSIARLGIEPVFPPLEDIFVGDIVIHLIPADGIDIQKIPDELKPLIGRGITVGRANLKAIIERNRQSPVIQQSANLDGTTSGSDHYLRPEVTDGLKLYVTAFPGVTVTTSTKSGTSWIDIALGRSRIETEEINIIKPETYSISVPEAAEALMNFCSNPDTEYYCSDKYARSILSYAIDNRVNKKENGQYYLNLSVNIIRQVFLTQSIDTSRYRGDMLTADITTNSRNTDTADNTQPAREPNTWKFDHTGHFSTRLTMKQEFERPIVFGFRRISINIPKG